MTAQISPETNIDDSQVIDENAGRIRPSQQPTDKHSTCSTCPGRVTYKFLRAPQPDTLKPVPRRRLSSRLNANLTFPIECYRSSLLVQVVQSKLATGGYQQ